MYIAYNQVRMHDTDMAGILYFPRVFRFAQDALEDFLDNTGYTFHQIFKKDHFIFVIAHAESDYFAPVFVGDKLEIHVTVSHIGTSSFTVLYEIYNQDKVHVGRAKTVHVTLNTTHRKAIPIPEDLKKLLEEHLV